MRPDELSAVGICAQFPVIRFRTFDQCNSFRCGLASRQLADVPCAPHCRRLINPIYRKRVLSSSLPADAIA